MDRKEHEGDAASERCRGAGRFNRAMAGLIVWLLMMPVLPVALYERWRRSRERRTPAGAAKERALQELQRKLKSTLRDMEREDRRNQT